MNEPGMPALPPLRLAWSADDAVGIDAVDDAHRALLACCEQMAQGCTDAACGDTYDEALAGFKALARRHLDEQALRLATLAGDAARADEARAEREEFDAMVDDVVSTTHFDRVELQRYVALWTLGHIRACAARWRAGRSAG